MKNHFWLCAMVCLLLLSCKDKNPDIPVTPVIPTNGIDTDPIAFAAPFSGVPVIKEVVMYEVNLRAFSADGNFKGVQARLDSIKALGVNVLWLMPIHPVGVLNSVGGLGSPYAVKNYKEINTEFGTLDDLQILVKEAHNRNMAVIVDWVANHTAWDNPWITAHPDWYTKDAAGKIAIPAGTNWNDVADLNYDNATMRLFMINAMKYWVLKANLDGFRCDYADGIPQDFWKQAFDSLKTIPNRNYILLAEGIRSDHFDAGFQLNYGWDFYGKLKNTYKSNLNPSGIFQMHFTELGNIPSNRFKLRFTTNHDESAWTDTPITLFNGQAGAMSAFVLSSYLGGVPLLYNGQEVGRADKTPFFTRSPINWQLNPSILAEYKRLLAFRQASNALKEGTVTTFPDDNVVAFKKIFQTEQVVVLVNIRNAISNFQLPAGLANTTWQNALDNTTLNLNTQLALTPYQYLILKP
jgi:glycosidase